MIILILCLGLRAVHSASTWNPAHVFPKITTVGVTSPEWDAMAERAHADVLRVAEHWRALGLREPAPLRGIFALGAYGDLTFEDALTLMNPGVENPRGLVLDAWEKVKKGVAPPFLHRYEARFDRDFGGEIGYGVRGTRQAAFNNPRLATLETNSLSLQHVNYRDRWDGREMILPSLSRGTLEQALATSPLIDGAIPALTAAHHLVRAYRISDETADDALSSMMVVAALERTDLAGGVVRMAENDARVTNADPTTPEGRHRLEIMPVLRAVAAAGDIANAQPVPCSNRFVQRSSVQEASRPLQRWFWDVRQSVAPADRAQVDRLLVEVLEDVRGMPLRNWVDELELRRRGKLDFAWLLPAALATLAGPERTDAFPIAVIKRTEHLKHQLEVSFHQMPWIGRAALFGTSMPRSYADVITPELLRTFDRVAQRSFPDLVPTLRRAAEQATGRAAYVMKLDAGGEVVLFPPRAPSVLTRGRLRKVVEDTEAARTQLKSGRVPSFEEFKRYHLALARLQEFERSGVYRDLRVPGMVTGTRRAVLAGVTTGMCFRWLTGG